MSRETVQIALTIVTLNDLEVKLGNILNAYIQATVRKLWTTLGPAFGKGTGKTAVIIRALYGLKIKSETRQEDGVQFYSHLWCYVDDILCIHHNADAVLQGLNKSFPLQSGYGNPDMYLGANLCWTRLHNGV